MINLKTFKIASFLLADENEAREVEMIDGLIINQEDDKSTWLIELFVDPVHEPLFHSYEQQEELTVQVHITHRSNDPALLSVQIKAINKLEKGTSVLLEGILLQRRNEYAKQVLSELIDEGLEGKELVETFSTYLQQRKNIPSTEKP